MTVKDGESPDKLNALKLAYKAIEQMQAKLTAYETKLREPIAIVGMACRWPGSSNTPAALWKLLYEGRSAVTQSPPPDRAHYFDVYHRINGIKGETYAAFVDQVTGFDPKFFGITEEEAIRIDPQQRLLLEVAYEAFEDAGIARDRLTGSRAGVYVGCMDMDYSHLSYKDPRQVNEFTFTGTLAGLLANRISYVFDLKGPSMALDAVCPSGLVGVDTACRALRAGDIEHAVVGGVTLNLSGDLIAGMSTYVHLAPDGKHRSYDAKANGIVMGEGCGVMLLKRLSDAIQDGDRIHALIRSSTVGQLGRTNGLNSPGAIATANVMKRAIDEAGLAPSAISMIEGHGAGVPIGDLAEIEAYQRFFQGVSADAKTYLGSIKTNLGHTKGSCSMAALFKVVLCLENKKIVPSLHFEQTQPGANLPPNVTIPSETMEWKRADGDRFGMVEIYGAGGTVAAIVLGEAPAVRPSERAPTPSWGRRELCVLPISAHTDAALDARIEAFSQHVGDIAARQGDLFDVCFTASTRRWHHGHRAALMGRNPAELASALAAWKSGQAPANAFRGNSTGQRRRLLFNFSDVNAWAGASWKELLGHPAFAQTKQECLAELESAAERSLVEATFNPEGSPRAESPLSVFVLQLALTRLWASMGVTPNAVVGSGVGRVTAAYVAEALSLKDALAVVRDSKKHVPTVTQPKLTLLDPATGRGLTSSLLGADYWRQVGPETISPESIGRTVAESSHDLLLDIGPASASLASAAAANANLLTAHSLSPAGDSWAGLLSSLCQLYSAGFDVNWNRAYADAGKIVDLPAYPWQRKRYWVEDVEVAAIPA